MSILETLDTIQQENLISYIKQSLDNYRTSSQEYRDQMLRIYEALSTFEDLDTGENIPRFKVNKAHPIVRKKQAKIINKAPKIIVSEKTDIFKKGDEKKVGKDREDMLKNNKKIVLALQDYLNNLFQEEDLVESLEYWVLNQLTYGNAFSEIIPSYRIQRSKTKTVKGQKVTEEFIQVLPTINIISWSEIFYDPRFKKLKDMPGIFRVREGVRLQDLEFAKNDDGEKKYFNLEDIKKLANVEFTDADTYSILIKEVTGINGIKLENGINRNELTLETFYGKYSFPQAGEETEQGDPNNERLYEITTVNTAIIIGIEEITQIPIVDLKALEDPELFFAVGLVAPILGLQDELNFQKNSQATAISQSLNRHYWWNEASGVNPQDLVGDKAGHIIHATKGVQNALRELQEIPHLPLPSQYFNNINDYNRDINNMSFTSDVTQPGGQQALTNTATGARIDFFENNVVDEKLRKNFERAVRELAYKLLEWTANNIEDNLLVKNTDSGKFLEINKEALKESLKKYEIRVEPGSSTFDDVENRRNEAIAIKNILLEGKQAGVNVDLDEAYRSILSSFESLDLNKIIPPKEKGLDVTGLLGGGQEGGRAPRGGQAGVVEEETPEALTRGVARGKITS